MIRATRARYGRLVLAAVVTLAALASTGEAPGSSPLPLPAKQRAVASYSKLPLHFEPNQGQTDEQVRFFARGSGYGLFLTPTESALSGSGWHNFTDTRLIGHVIP